MRLRLALVVLGWAATSARAATECPERVPAAARAAGVVCTEWTSRFDGWTDHAFVRFPSGYDPSRPVDVLLWLHGYKQGDAAISDPALHAAGDRLGAITVGLSQRGIRNFLGDSTTVANPLVPAERLAAKQDIAELLDKLGARFHVRHVIAAGTSMGGYAALRLATLFPRRVSIVLGTAPTVCGFSADSAPDCRDSFLYAGSQAVYQAARAGGFDDKLVYLVAGAADDTPGLLAGDRALARILDGRRWFHYHEVAGGGHENYFQRGGGWVADSAVTPGLTEALAAWAAAHPTRAELPGPDWRAPSKESQQYLTPTLRARGAGGAESPHASADRGAAPLQPDAWEASGPLRPLPSAGCNGPAAAAGLALGIAAVLAALGLAARRRRA